MKARRIATLLVVFVVLALSVGHAEVLPPGGGSGAIFTTTPDGGIVNENVHYEAKNFVYLDGGPKQNAPPQAAGLDEGFYVFQVTDPPGKLLLSVDPARCRIVHVTADGVIDQLMAPTDNTLADPDGYTVFDYTGATTDNWSDDPTNGKFDYSLELCHVAEAPDPYDPADPDDAGVNVVNVPDFYGLGRHDTNTDDDHGLDMGAIVFQLMPYGTTPNPGGVYKAWLTPIQAYVDVKGADLNDIPSDINGKVKPHDCPDFCANRDPGFTQSGRYWKTDNFKVKEFYPPEIRVRKFHDINGNRLWDAGEPEIGVDQCVQSEGPNEGDILATCGEPPQGGWPYWWTFPLDGGTDTDTFYTPWTHVAGIPGTYTAEEWFLAGWKQTAAYLDGDPSTGDGFVYDNGGPSKAVSVDVMGMPWEDYEIVFGNTRPGRIFGYKVIDYDADGVLDPEDICDPLDAINYPGCAGVTVYLDGLDNLGNEVHQTTLTGADGYYEFDDLWPGSYTVSLDEPPVLGFECSYPEYDNCNYDVGILSGDVEGPYDFGDFSRAEVYGRKVIDVTANGPSYDDTCPLDPDPWGNNAGCQGVTVYLEGTDGMGNPVSLDTTTDGEGYFEFLNLWPGIYTVTVDEPDGFYCSYPAPCEFERTLTSDEVADDLLFGDFSKAEVYGRKVIDIYADGPSEDDTCPLYPDDWGNNAGCQGVLVDLDGHTYMDVHVHLQTYTDENGYFEFLDLFPGDYTIALEEPEGFFCSYPDPCYFPLSLMSDQIADGLLFGDYSKAEIHAFKCFDADESGTCEPCEDPVPGIEFCLYDGDGALVSCQFTDDYGFVHWTDLEPGTYTVEETLPEGWFCTGDASQTATLMSDQIWEPEFGNVTNCVGLTPGYWVNWDNHYDEAQFLILLEGTIAEGDIGLANFYLTSVGCDNGDALHCMQRFLLANQLTLNLAQYPDFPNPDDAILWYVCEVPGYPGNLGYWLGEALAIHDAGGIGYDRDYILWVKTMLDKFANLDIRYYP